MKALAIILIVLVVVAVVVGPQTFFVVDETNTAVVTRFGEPIRSITSPGLYVKTPFVERVVYFDKRLLVFDAPADSLLTKDKKQLVIDVYARGRITDPQTFLERVSTEARAANRVIPLVSGGLRSEIANDDQSDIIKANREEIMVRVTEAVKPELDEFGITLVDVRIKRADFPSAIADSVYQRMIAERRRIANRERAQGAEVDLEVRATVNRTAIEIRSDAVKDADIIRGCAEAKSIAIFAAALEQDPEFFSFQRSLEAYKSYLVQNTTVVGSAVDLGQMFADIRRGVDIAASVPEGGISGTTVAAEGPVPLCDEVEVRRAAQELLSKELGVDAVALPMMSIEVAEWPDSSLGCPVAGRDYPELTVVGYTLFLTNQDTTYEVHSSKDGTQVVRCP